MAIVLVVVGWLIAALLLGLMFGRYLGWVSGHYPKLEQGSAGGRSLSPERGRPLRPGFLERPGLSRRSSADRGPHT
jgi:hypothetical protein